MQYVSKTLAKGKKILLYWDSQQVVLQLRHQVAAEDDIMTPSVRVAVALTPIFIWRMRNVDSPKRDLYTLEGLLCCGGRSDGPRITC